MIRRYFTAGGHLGEWGPTAEVSDGDQSQECDHDTHWRTIRKRWMIHTKDLLSELDASVTLPCSLIPPARSYQAGGSSGETVQRKFFL